MRTTTRLGAVAATAAGTLLLSGLGAVAPAQAAAGLMIDTITYAPAYAESPSPYVPLNCGVEIDFTDPTRGYDYDVEISPEVDVDVYLEADYDGGFFYVDCGDADSGFQNGVTYAFTVVEYNDRGRITETASQSFTFNEVGAPVDAWVESGGQRVEGGTLPTGLVDLRFEGEFEPGTSFLTLVRYSPTTNFGAADEARNPVASRYVSSGSMPATQLSVPHNLGGGYVWISVRAQRAGRAPVVFAWEPFRAITPPATQPVPASFVHHAGQKSGPATAGYGAAVTRVNFTETGESNGARPHYQWFLDGKKIPGATTDTYVPPVSTVGRRLTLGLQITAPGYLPRNGSFDFGVVGQRSVPAGWVKAPATKSGTARVGSTVAVSGPALTPTAVSSGAKTYYQWFLDGKKIPGATSRTYKVPAAAKGKTLTVGIAVTKTAWKPLNQTVGFGRVG
ncbi:MAG: hypothetical protein PIR53_00790 [Nocardioides alkalitolerans]